MPQYKEMELPIFSSKTVTAGDQGAILTNLVTFVQKDNTSGQTVRDIVRRPSITQTLTLAGTGTIYSTNSDLGLYHRGTEIRKLADNSVVKTGVAAAQSQFLRHDYNNTWVVMFCDGTNVYSISQTYVVTTITTGITNPNPWMVSLDTYLFISPQNSNIIYNSDVNALTFNLSVNLIASSLYAGNIVALVKHNNQLVAMKEKSLEFFYDAGFTSTSPLQRNQNMAIQVGCSSPLTITQDENQTLFLGAGVDGTVGAWKLDGFQIDRVSNAGIEQEITKYPNYYVGFFVRIYGSTIYFLSFNDQALVYDLDNKVWYNWLFSPLLVDSYVPYVSQFVGKGSSDNTYIDSSGRYLLLQNDYYDLVESTVHNIQSSIKIQSVDFGTSNKKFMRSMSISGAWSGNLSTALDINEANFLTPISTRVYVYTDLTENQKIFQLGQARRFNVNLFLYSTSAFKINSIKVELTMGTS